MKSGSVVRIKTVHESAFCAVIFIILNTLNIGRLIRCAWIMQQGDEAEATMKEMVESTVTGRTYVAHVPVPSQKEVKWLSVNRSGPQQHLHVNKFWKFIVARFFRPIAIRLQRIWLAYSYNSYQLWRLATPSACFIPTGLAKNICKNHNFIQNEAWKIFDRTDKHRKLLFRS